MHGCVVMFSFNYLWHELIPELLLSDWKLMLELLLRSSSRLLSPHSPRRSSSLLISPSLSL